MIRFFVPILIVAITLVFTSQAFAQSSFDIPKYVKGLDKNGNSILDTDEVSGRTGSWLRKSGFDTSRPISVRKVIGKLAKDQKTKAKAKKREENRKVPGFGVEAEKDPVSNFSVEAKSAVSMEAKYGKKVMDQVRNTLKRYDRNKNGIMEKDEVSRARWGNPSASSSDRNKDGSLTQIELAERYAVRERAARLSNSAAAKSNPSSSSRSSTSRSYSNRRPTSKTSRFRSSSKSVSTPTKSTSSTTRKAFNSGNDKYLRYADGLIKQYDKNKDGKISKDEAKEMRRAPTGADANKDGYITKSELVDSLSGKNKTSSSTASKSRSESKSRFGSRGSRSRSTSKSRRTVSFSDDDANQDGQLQMSEYSDEWDQEILDEFKKRDLNNDGIITAEEWSQSKG